jgi:hypothetical protein
MIVWDAELLGGFLINSRTLISKPLCISCEKCLHTVLVTSNIVMYEK